MVETTYKTIAVAARYEDRFAFDRGELHSNIPDSIVKQSEVANKTEVQCECMPKWSS